MIHSIRGELLECTEKTAVIDCQGVGFLCHISLQTVRQLPAPGGTARLFTVLNVREDAMELFGFADRAELDAFRLLTSVNGVGPKAAMSILSEMAPARVLLCAAAGDYKALTRAQGVGPKLAQRIVLELKDKAPGVMSEGAALPANADIGMGADGNATKAVDALVSLGFSVSEAAAAVGKIDRSLPVEAMIREALKALAKG